MRLTLGPRLTSAAQEATLKGLSRLRSALPPLWPEGLAADRFPPVGLFRLFQGLRRCTVIFARDLRL